ncbi:MAG: Nramp family divalent metal transporter [Bacteroidia bacterium]|nr:Nramp family divalent metal transporter [Bacteroidia bacterium]
MLNKLKKLGPGLLFAGAAIGVSHLVQSTRAGADYGFGLIWALLLVHLFKYPFFQYAARYAGATGESLLEGYYKLGKGVLVIYLVLTFATMFTIQTAVTIVTAGIANTLFGGTIGTEIWSVIILGICIAILILGRYKFLDNLMKVIIVMLTVSTMVAVFLALKDSNTTIAFEQILPRNEVGIVFLIAFMGWMPAPLDISVWQSLWTIEKKKNIEIKTKAALFDFNIGYASTIVLGIGFVSLGSIVMYNSGETFSNSASEFSRQLINMYTNSLGNWAYALIGIAALTTMFSTTLTTLDASPRAMHKTTQLLFKKNFVFGYKFWIGILTIGTISILLFFISEMGFLVKTATVLSFITAPFYAIVNYRLLSSRYTPKEWRPSTGLHILSILGILFLIGFSIWYLTIL